MPPSNNKSITRYSRRTAGSMILGAIGSLLLPQRRVFAESSASRLRPFRVNIPQARIDHIIKRVREATCGSSSGRCARSGLSTPRPRTPPGKG